MSEAIALSICWQLQPCATPQRPHPFLALQSAVFVVKFTTPLRLNPFGFELTRFNSIKHNHVS